MHYSAWMLIAALLFSSPLADAGICILPKPYVEMPKFAGYLYQTADSIALARVVAVRQDPSSELGSAAVEIIEILKGESWNEFGFHTRRMPTLPTPRKGEVRLIALNRGVAGSCLNLFVWRFEMLSLTRELRRLRDRSMAPSNNAVESDATVPALRASARAPHRER